MLIIVSVEKESIFNEWPHKIFKIHAWWLVQGVLLNYEFKRLSDNFCFTIFE